ncbi:MAG: hypothetical protein D6710_04495 [Nitrospirae bacterium]|nr:MAG: hypothetical protein D6710_04495 [Nitrospirota bacterium]
MKSWSNRLSYVGAGVSLALFVLFGLMPGTLISGLIGLKVIGALFGIPVEPTLVSRLLLAVFLFTGVFVTALIFVIAGTTIGWLVGLLIDGLIKRQRAVAIKKAH